MISPTPASTVPAATEPSSKRGTMTLSITQRTATLEATVHRANTAAPATAMTNGRGCSRTCGGDHRRSPRERGRTAASSRRRSHGDVSTSGAVGSATRPRSSRRAVGSVAGVDPIDLALLVRAAGVRAVPRRPRLQQGLRRRRPRRHGAVVRLDRHALAAASRPGSPPRTEIGAGLLFAARPADAVRRRRDDRRDGRGHVGGPPQQRVLHLPQGPGLGVHGVDRRRRLGASPRSAPASSASTTPSGSTGRRGTAGSARVIAGVLGVGGGDRPARRLLPPARRT